MSTTATTSEQAAPHAHGPGRPRRILAGVLAILASVIVAAGAIAVWVDRTALETDTWVDVSEQVLQQPEVYEPLSRLLAERVQARVDLEAQLAAALPPRLQPLASPASAAFDELTVRATERFVTSPRFLALWAQAMRLTHAEAIAVIDGRTAISDLGPGLTVDTSAILIEIASRAGLPDPTGRLAAHELQIVVVPGERLSKVRQAVHLLRLASFWLVLIALALYAAAVWLAADRRGMVGASGLGILIAALVLVIARAVVARTVPEMVASTPDGEAAARATWKIVSGGLADISTTLAAVGLLGMLWAWLAGPRRHAARLRSFIAPWLADARLAFGGLVLVALAVIAWAPTRGARTPMTIVIVLALAVVGLELLRRQTAREGRAPDAEPVAGA